jgi:aminopeptidase N
MPSNQRNFVYCAAIRHGTTKDWKYLWAKFENSDYAVEKLDILSALACSENSTNLEKYINYKYNINFIRRYNINKISVPEFYTRQLQVIVK